MKNPFVLKHGFGCSRIVAILVLIIIFGMTLFAQDTKINQDSVRMKQIDSLKIEINENANSEKWLNNQFSRLQSQIYKLKSDVLDLKEQQEMIMRNRTELLKRRTFIQSEIDKLSTKLINNKKEK